MTEIANGTSHKKEHKKHKKRSHDEAIGQSTSTGDGATSKPSKEERREAKRRKQLEKANVPSEGNQSEVQVDGNLSIEEKRVEINGDVATKKPSKEERKEAKRLKKLAQASGQAKEQVEKALEGDTTVGSDKAADKAKRKAERARLKALKKNSNADTKSPSVPSSPKDPINGNTKTKSKQSVVVPSQTSYQEAPSLTALPQSEIDTFLSTNFINIEDPTSTTPLRPITQFSYLPQSTSSTSSPFTAFKLPTPIQSAAWPFLLSGRDVIGVAETGSGKTLAFGVPCIRSITSSLSNPKGSSPGKAVIISPTRELAVQIHSQMVTLASSHSLTTVCVYGGVPKDAQRSALKTAAIIVATPGRLKDLMDEGSADLSNVKYLVLDEADRMLDKGFEEEIRKIISTTPITGRQTLMFTATWPQSVRTLASTFMTTPVHISIGADNPTHELRANTSITQLVEVVDPRGKEQRLLQILKEHTSGKKKNERILIFCLYKKEAARVEQFLRQRAGMKVAPIHGDLSQVARQTSLDNFKSGSCPLLVATDVAARGLDIPAVKVVINVTFPLTVEDYVHRIGRTGRAGAEGLAITLFTEHDKGLAGGLINVLRAAGQEIPEDLLKFGTTVKKKGHEAYGAFYKDPGEGVKKEGTKIRFD